MTIMISFIIPCYRSEHTVTEVIDGIGRVANTLLPDYDYEIVAVDDCSPDEVYHILKEIARINHKLKVIHMSRNLGQHSALLAGLNYAKGDYCVTLDDDGQCPIERVDDLLAPLRNGYDVTVAKYDKKHQSIFKNFGSEVNEILTSWLTCKPRGLRLSNFWAIRRNTVNEIIRYKGPYPSLASLAIRSTSKIINVPMQEHKRQTGETTYTVKKLAALLFSNLLGFTLIPLRFAIAVGGITAIVGITYAGYIIIHKIVNPDIPIGWSSLIATNLVTAGMILLFLGVIGEYIGRIFMSLNATPQYVIDETINLNADEN